MSENHRRPEENKLRDPLAQRTLAFIYHLLSDAVKQENQKEIRSERKGREIDGVNQGLVHVLLSFGWMRGRGHSDTGKAAVYASAIPKHDTARRKALIFPSISPSIFCWPRGGGIDRWKDGQLKM